MALAPSNPDLNTENACVGKPTDHKGTLIVYMGVSFSMPNFATK